MSPPAGTRKPDQVSPLALAALADLLVRSGHGDQQAFAEFYDRTAPSAYRIARRRLLPPLAERVTCRAFMHLWEQSARYTPDTDPMAWLLAVVHRSAFHELQRIRRDHAQLAP